MKRFLTLLLVLVMALSLIPTTALAAPGGGPGPEAKPDGSQANPYVIIVGETKEIKGKGPKDSTHGWTISDGISIQYDANDPTKIEVTGVAISDDAAVVGHSYLEGPKQEQKYEYIYIKVIPCTHDRISTVNSQAATCIASGYESCYQCDTCKEYSTNGDKATFDDGLIADLDAWKAEGGAGYIAPTDIHIGGELTGKADPTCTASGCIGYSACTGCGENVYLQENEWIVIADLDTWKAEGGAGYIAPYGHDYAVRQRDDKKGEAADTVIVACQNKGCKSELKAKLALDEKGEPYLVPEEGNDDPIWEEVSKKIEVVNRGTAVNKDHYRINRDPDAVPDYVHIQAHFDDKFDFCMVHDYYIDAPVRYTLTIHYLFADDESEAYEDYTAALTAGTEYSVESPVLSVPYNSDWSVVTGTMPEDNVELTVYYYPAPIYVGLGSHEEDDQQAWVLKELKGNLPKNFNETFTVTLTEVVEAPAVPMLRAVAYDEPVNIVGEVTMTEKGTAVFEFIDGLTFNKAGTYKYTVKEVNGKTRGMKYDKNEYTLIVTVTEDHEVGLVATADAVTVSNAYRRASSSTTPVEQTSPKTADAGIAIYGVLSIMSVMGSAVVIGKKKEF